MKLNPHKAGLALGVTFVVYHFTWLVSLLLGLGDLWIKWTSGLHFVSVEYEFLSFDFVTAIVGLAGAFVLGYLMGWLFGFVWQKLN